MHRPFVVRLGSTTLFSLLGGFACSSEDDGTNSSQPNNGGMTAIGAAYDGTMMGGGSSMVSATAVTTGGANVGSVSTSSLTSFGGATSMGAGTTQGGTSVVTTAMARGGSTSSGGTSAKGGAIAIGGTKATGGSTARGGNSTTGGIAATGGTSVISTGADGCGDTLALGVTLKEIAVFQTGKISIMQSGVATSGTSANGAEIVDGRPTVVRAYVTADSGFTSRHLSARLTLNGTTYYSKQTISGSSSELSPANSFLINVPASAMTASPNYSLRIVECVGGAGASHNPQFPASGTASIPTRNTGRIKITMLPMKTGNALPELASLVPSVKAHIEAQYPATEVQITLHSTPMDDCGISAATAGDGNTWADCLESVRIRRTADAPVSGEYYLAITKPTSSFNSYCVGGCISGISYVVTSSSSWAANSRALVAVGYDPQVLNTITHELGHAHGLYHSPGCQADDADGDFPYVTNGKAYIGWVGWDNRNPSTFIDPAKYTDLMSYCSPLWVSDYIYAQMAERIASLNSAAMWTGTESLHTWRVLNVVGHRPSWGTPITVPSVAFGTPETAIVFDSTAEPLAEVTVYRTDISNSIGAMYIVPEPELNWSSVLIGSIEVAF